MRKGFDGKLYCKNFDQAYYTCVNCMEQAVFKYKSCFQEAENGAQRCKNRPHIRQRKLIQAHLLHYTPSIPSRTPETLKGGEND